MNFRLATINDYEALTDLWEKAGLHYKPNGRDSKDKIELELKRGIAYFLLALDGSKIIGSVIASHDGRKGWINRLAVLPEYQNKGIAKQLIEESEHLLKKEGIEIFTCLIEDWNQKSMNLFQNSGYVKHQEIIYFSKRIREDI